MRLAIAFIGVHLTVAVLGQEPKATPSADWMLVRSVPNGDGNTSDFVVVAERRRADRAYYGRITDTVCASRTRCMVYFWTNREHVPNSPWMSGAALSQMTAKYERSPAYQVPVLRLACWLYPTKAEAERAECFYLPGARVPWSE